MVFPIMKILLAITELGAGGAEKIVAVLAGEYIRLGHSVTVLCLQGPPSEPAIPEMIRSAGAEIRYLGLRKTQLGMLRKIRKAVLAEAPDVVHAHLIHANLLLRLALRKSGIPLVNTVHISERRRGKKHFFLLDRWTFSMADAVTAVSDASARFHERACGLPAGSIRTIRNGSDPVIPASEEELRAFRAEWDLDSCDAVLGSIGRLDFQKGYDLLLDRCGALAGRIPAGRKWILLILGDGPERERLLARAKSLQCPGLRICFAGFRKNAASLMTCFHVFLMPSRYEGYGLALAEAMSLGLPVVCSDVDSLPELCAQYKGFSRGIRMESDPDGVRLAEAVSEALLAPRVSGQTLVTNREMAQNYLTLYGELLEKRRHCRVEE